MVSEKGEAARLFLHVFDRAAVGMAIQDAGGCILKANEPYCLLLGRSERELQGLTWQAITHPDDIAQGEALLRRARETEPHGFEFEKRYLRPDGSLVWAHTIVTVIEHAGSPDYQLVQAVDITARVEAERQGKEFLRDLSHELRTPLTSILGASTALSGRMSGTEPAIRDQLIGLIAENAERMRGLLDRLQGYSRETLKTLS